MALADFAGGVQQSLQQMIARRLEQQELARRAQMQEMELAQGQQRIDQGARGLELESRGLDLREQAHNTTEAIRPMTLSEGQSLVDPSSGRIIAGIPKSEQPQRPISLAPGGSLVDPTSGRIIASMPDRPTKPEKSTADMLQEYEAKKKIDAQYMGARPSLGGERNTLNYFNRMLEAERNARAVEDQITDYDSTMSGNIPLMPDFAENFLRTEAGQKYLQAQRMFTEARLRKESGAAIPESEFANDRRINFRSAGDKPDTLKQKRQSRIATMRGIGNASGRALQEYYGEGATLEQLLKEFEDQQAAQATPAKPTAADLIKKYGGR